MLYPAKARDVDWREHIHLYIAIVASKTSAKKSLHPTLFFPPKFQNQRKHEENDGDAMVMMMKEKMMMMKNKKNMMMMMVMMMMMMMMMMMRMIVLHTARLHNPPFSPIHQQ